MKQRVIFTFLLLLASTANAGEFDAAIAMASDKLESRVIEWRRDIHQNPELSNREFRTSKLVAEHLRKLGMQVTTEVAHTGVVGVLVGGKPGPVVALRADMDGLPVEELTGLPFASKAMSEYKGEQVPVMHACGHDAHVSILMGVASLLAGMQEDIPGTVKFIFQPAEEGPPPGEQGGAVMMVKEGVLDGKHAPEAIFGLHVWPMETHTLGYRAAGTMAAADGLEITITGKQTHGSSPWLGVDPISISAQILNAIQMIPSRQLDVTNSPAVITVGSIHGGVRGNIIPNEVKMSGTIRTFDPGIRDELHLRLIKTVTQIADAAGAKASVEISSAAPVTYNDPELLQKMIPSLEAASPGMAKQIPVIMGAEDFSIFQQKIPGVYFFLGINKKGVKTGDGIANHSNYFDIDEDSLKTGVRALSTLALDYLVQSAN